MAHPLLRVTTPGRPRKSGCTALHALGGRCATCERLNRRRYRKLLRSLGETDERPSEDPKAHQRAVAYVHAYLRRGAIVPPGACERCDRAVQSIAGGRSRPVYAWHPDVAKPREVAWLCEDCRLEQRRTREPLELSWVWPGVGKRTRGEPHLDEAAALDYAERTVAPLVAIASATLRAETFVGAYISALNARDREAIYAVASLRGDRWSPSMDRALTFAWRTWFLEERASRGELARMTSTRLVAPTPIRERRRYKSTPPSETSSSAPRTAEPFDAALQAAQMAESLDRLSDAEIAIDALNRSFETMFGGLSSRVRSQES